MNIKVNITTQVILSFSFTLGYDLLEDRRTIDVIITKFIPLCFKMKESFVNLDNIIRDCAKVRKAEQYQLAVEQTKPSTKLVLVSQEPLLYLEFNKPKKQVISEIK